MISGFGGVTREMTQLGNHWAKQNLLLQKDVPQIKSPVSKHTGWEVHSDCISNASLPLTLIERISGSQLSQLAKKKRGHVGQGTLRQGKQRFTWTIVAISKQFLKLGHLAIIGTYSAENSPLFKTGIYRVKWHLTRHVGNNLGKLSWHLYNANILYINPFDRKDLSLVDSHTHKSLGGISYPNHNSCLNLKLPTDIRCWESIHMLTWHPYNLFICSDFLPIFKIRLYFLFSWQHWSLNSGFCFCKASTLSFEPLPQLELFIFLSYIVKGFRKQPFTHIWLFASILFQSLS
jgi:hypothetical protein